MFDKRNLLGNFSFVLVVRERLTSMILNFSVSNKGHNRDAEIYMEKNREISVQFWLDAPENSVKESSVGVSGVKGPSVG